jgi:hypothetical protein
MMRFSFAKVACLLVVSSFSLASVVSVETEFVNKTDYRIYIRQPGYLYANELTLRSGSTYTFQDDHTFYMLSESFLPTKFVVTDRKDNSRYLLAHWVSVKSDGIVEDYNYNYRPIGSISGDLACNHDIIKQDDKIVHKLTFYRDALVGAIEG